MIILSVFEEYKALIKTKMGDKRYIHSVNMAKQAVHLAEKYGADIEKAQIAGILHDITKALDGRDQLRLCDKYGIVISDFDRAHTKLLHVLGVKLVDSVACEYGNSAVDKHLHVVFWDKAKF